MKKSWILLLVGLGVGLVVTSASAKTIDLLNVSYDPTRELYQDYNTVFAAYWKKQTGDQSVLRVTQPADVSF